MENLSMCRICLATDVRLCSLSSHLRDMFERISSMTFKREDRRPLVTCYICLARLQNCYRLRTSCRQSEKLLSEMLSSGELKPQDMLSITNTFRAVSVLHLSLGHVKEEASEDISDADQLYTEDIVTEAQEELCGQIEDNNQVSHLEDPLNIVKEEADDVETDAEYIKLEGNINLEEIGWEPDIGPSSQFADNICPKIVKVVSERIDLNDSRVGARVLKKFKIAAMKDTENATTNARKIEGIKNEQTETITIKEPKIVTMKIEVEKPVTTNKILKTCDEVDNNLKKCDNVVTSIDNNVCEEKSTNTSLEQNISSVSSSKNNLFSCDTCNKCFYYKHILKRHILTHTGDKPYQCNVCNKLFTQKSYLQIHIRAHAGEKPYQCNVCKKCFTLKRVLKTHIGIHTSDKPYQCNVCKKCFNQKCNLKRHIGTHSGEKPYQCNVCKKCFSQKNNLQTHIQTHTGEKPYQCNVCNKCFSYKHNLKTHIRSHTYKYTSDKPYQCNICKKGFIQKGDLIKHIRIHSGEKPYQCNVCNKCFTQKCSLKTHLRIHSGAKPYQCNVCNKCFRYKHYIKTHICTHSGEPLSM